MREDVLPFSTYAVQVQIVQVCLILVNGEGML